MGGYVGVFCKFIITVYLVVMNYHDKFKVILEIKRYSKSTIESYGSFFKLFQTFYNYSDKNIESLQDRDVLNSIYKLIKVKQYSISSQKQLIGSISLFYKELFRRTIDFSLLYPTRKREYLPTVLSKNEVKTILKVVKNKKHKAIISTIYGLGLRISEVIVLEISDIDSTRMIVTIKNSKGNRDRIVMLPKTLLITLRDYFKEYKPKKYLFEGQRGGMYNSSSIRKFFTKAKINAEITKPATIHTLRHSFATHLFENGTDIRLIQKLLGHKNIKTTLIYTHISKSVISNIESPLDSL